MTTQSLLNAIIVTDALQKKTKQTIMTKLPTVMKT